MTVSGEGDSSFEPAWVARVRTAVHRIEGDLARSNRDRAPGEYAIAEQALARARDYAARPSRATGRRWSRPARRIAVWWTGTDVNQAWAAAHAAEQALLAVEPSEVVRSRVGDMAAMVVTTLTPGDLRVADYLKTLEILAKRDGPILPADRAQLAAILDDCHSASDGAKADARSFRNTLILLGGLLSVLVVAIAIVAWGDQSFRSVFAPSGQEPGRWYVLELELVASLAGLTGAGLALKSYLGFQDTYGLPLVQALLKASTGAATGLFGVLLVQSGLITALKPQTGGGVFAIAIIFGYAQYLFTRLVDGQANAVLTSAGSRNEPNTTPQTAPGTMPPTLLTTRVAPPPPLPPPPPPPPPAGPVAPAPGAGQPNDPGSLGGGRSAGG